MENIQIALIKYIFGFGLQSFMLVLGVYTFNKQKVVLRDYILTSMTVAIFSYLMKLLPITVGVQTILNMITMYLLCVIFLKMPPYRTIRSTSLCVVLILLSEMIVTSIAVQIVGQEQFQTIISDASQRYYIGLFANIIFAVIIVLLHLALRKKGEKNRSISAQDIV
ncbi:hypothetical protein ACHAL6_03930 [Proteiniclasticum sp. C24MP]|uniref:hypothetical protein n=1 Tax=Proteiniclasticum sp. C24MP TaxID=3374101 RepID=UPI0037548149